ncbi:hypothetical protein HYU23_02525 [Candidatus Woesearchaeota archaeon]|nr:hypothetical protein [Candidatus Woesearchaeota archaeon]
MAEKLNMQKTALSLGILFAVVHGVGTLFMSTWMKYWQWAHFVSMQYTATGFSFGAWVGGIVLAFVLGLIVGGLFALIYNKL